MKINNIKLLNFRNYENLNLDVKSPSSLLLGSNGQGKTNLLEAIKFVSVLKSFREDERINLIKLGKESAAILIEEENLIGKKKLKCVLNGNKLDLFINDKHIKSHNDFIGQLNVVSFTPRDVFLFKDSRATRRYFIDEELSKLSPAYSLAVKDFSKVLKERNELLKKETLDETLLEVLTKRLAKLNREISVRRNAFINELNKDLSNKFSSITGEERKLNLEYRTSLLNLSENEIFEKTMEYLNEDKRRESTHIGIHHDDIMAYIDDKDVSIFASQGQQRAVVITLKLVLIENIKKSIGEEPIVLLDDVFSELDIKHQKNLLNYLKNKNQLFISIASIDEEIKKDIAKDSDILKVINGQIQREVN